MSSSNYSGYKKYSNYKRSYPKYKPSYKKQKRPMFGRMDMAAYNMAKSALKLINVEKKFHNLTHSALAISSAATLHNIVEIAQGDTNSTRDGDSLKIISLMFKFTCKIHASALQTFIRVMLIKDTAHNSTTPTIGNILTSTGINASIVSGLAMNNRGRFQVLMNEIVSLDQNGKQSSVINKYFNLEQHILYSGATGAASEQTRNSLYFIFISDEVTNTPTITYYSRLRFVDN